MYSSNKTSASGMDKYVKGTARSLSPVYYKTAHGYTGGEMIYRKSDSTFDLAKADASATAEVLGVVVQTEGTDRFALCLEGEISLVAGNFEEGTLTGLVDGSTLFLSATTAGKFTWTEPSTVSYISKPIATVTSISGTIVKCVFNNFRGTTVGGTNLFTTIPLNNGTATTILNLSDDTMFPVGSCGELTGGECNILQTGASTDYIFGFKVLWAKTASNVVNIQPDAMQDAPPGFAFGTSGANIQVSFTPLANFESGKVRYAMNAAPVGAQLPLQIASSRITYSEPTMFRNRIINGNMAIDQRNAGASQNIAASSEPYTIDRFQVCNYFLTGNITAQRSTTAPTGFNYSLKVTNGTGEALVASDYGSIRQKIEGSSLFDLGFGTSSAKAITVSFWVRSSVAGNYTVGLINSAANRANRTVFSIAQVDTWERKTVSFLGDTTGTWATDSSIGMYLDIVLVAGSSQQDTPDTWTATVKEGASGACLNWVTSTNATFYLTGVQLEPGTVATPFEFRPYGTELALCQRYYFREIGGAIGFQCFGMGTASAATTLDFRYSFPVPMRVSPVIAGSNLGYVLNYGLGVTAGTVAASAYGSGTSATLLTMTTTGLTTSTQYFVLAYNTAAAYIEGNSEL